MLLELQNFWLRLWSPQTDSTQAQGRAFVYAEDGSLLGEYPMEANPATAPTKGAQHIWLPTANGPMPIAVVGEGRQYAVHADHLNTPRRLTQEDGKVAWQWAYSAFGEEAPTTAATRFTSATTNPTTGSTTVPLVQYNLRYPGQYFDEESGLHYNHFRSYDSKSGRYTQFDPIGLAGGPNGFLNAGANPLSNIDPNGLDIVVITGGRREATNPFGHSALGVTGAGVFSYGNGTLLGSSVTSYVTSQSQYRNQQITIIPTTPEQDAAALKKLYGQGCKNCVGYFDNCAVRTNSALEAAGLRTGATGFPGSVARGAAGLPGAQTYTIPQDGPIPQSVIDALKQFTPTYVP